MITFGTGGDYETLSLALVDYNPLIVTEYKALSDTVENNTITIPTTGITVDFNRKRVSGTGSITIEDGTIKNGYIDLPITHIAAGLLELYNCVCSESVGVGNSIVEGCTLEDIATTSQSRLKANNCRTIVGLYVDEGVNCSEDQSGSVGLRGLPREKYAIYPIKCGTGLFDFRIENVDVYAWYFDNGDVVTNNTRPTRTLTTAQTIYWVGLPSETSDLPDINTNSNYIGDLEDVPLCLDFRVSFISCINMTGDISMLSNVRDVIEVRFCQNLKGILNPTSTLNTIRLDSTGLSKNDVDQTVINLRNNTTVTSGGLLTLTGLMRTSLSTDAINYLSANGWSVTDATVED